VAEGEGENSLRTATEMILGEVWGAMLGVAGVGPHDHFFELGGTSLQAAPMIVKLSERFIAERDAGGLVTSVFIPHRVIVISPPRFVCLCCCFCSEAVIVPLLLLLFRGGFVCLRCCFCLEAVFVRLCCCFCSEAVFVPLLLLLFRGRRFCVPPLLLSFRGSVCAPLLLLLPSGYVMVHTSQNSQNVHQKSGSGQLGFAPVRMCR
jgi:hypothetical protein